MAARSTLPIFRFESLSRHPLLHGVTGRHPSLPGEGDVNIAGRLERHEAFANRVVWADEIGVDASAIVTGRQVHGNSVQVVDETYAGRGASIIGEAIPSTDALVTRAVGLPLLVYTADCVPIVVYDPANHALGVAHAGWRGTVSNVAGALVETMSNAFGSDPGELVVGIGPSIGPCCYEVGDEVIAGWRDLGLNRGEEAVVRHGNRLHLDLWRANELAFEESGVVRERIERSEVCTRCQSDRYFSRRAGVGHRGLFATIAALTPLTDSDLIS